MPDSCEVNFIHIKAVEKAREKMRSENSCRDIAEFFHLFGDSTRLRIVDALSAGELCVCDLAHLLGVSESAVSHQLRLLRTARIVKNRRQGRIIFYTLADKHILALLQNAFEHLDEPNENRGARK